SDSGNELLLPFVKRFHPFQRLFFGKFGSLGPLNLELLDIPLFLCHHHLPPARLASLYKKPGISSTTTTIRVGSAILHVVDAEDFARTLAPATQGYRIM